MFGVPMATLVPLVSFIEATPAYMLNVATCVPHVVNVSCEFNICGWYAHVIGSAKAAVDAFRVNVAEPLALKIVVFFSGITMVILEDLLSQVIDPPVGAVVVSAPRYNALA